MSPFESTDFSDAFMAFYAVYMIVIYGIAIAFSVVSYVLSGKSLSAIARRRGIEKPWLAWVPVGNAWLLGCISDQYRYVVHGLETNNRGKLLKMNIIMLAGSLLVCVVSVAVAIVSDGVAEAGALLSLWILLMLCYGLIALLVIYTVQLYKAYYDLFRSCDPDKSLVYLLVSIFTSYPLPFFVFACRNKDLGMPPRQQPEQLPEAE